MEKPNRKRVIINRNSSADKCDAASLCFDLLWMQIEKNNTASIGFVTKDQLKVFAEKIHLSGFLSGVNFERCK